MIDKRIRAIYEDGILKPLEPLELAEKQVVELQIRTLNDQPGIAHLEGILAPYWEGESPSFEEIEAILQEQKTKSFERLMRQINGDFTEDDSST